PFGSALAAALAAAHDRGLFHGGLTLGNVLWAPGRVPQILGTGVAALGLADQAALARGDVAALGRVLCALVAGWQAPGAGAGFGGDVSGGVGELVRRLADPREAITMREAYALLAEGEPTQTTNCTGGSEELAEGQRPRASDTGASRGTVSTARD